MTFGLALFFENLKLHLYYHIFFTLNSSTETNSGIHLACVAWRFWLDALSNKGGLGQRNREEIGVGAT